LRRAARHPLHRQGAGAGLQRHRPERLGGPQPAPRGRARPPARVRRPALAREAPPRPAAADARAARALPPHRRRPRRPGGRDAPGDRPARALLPRGDARLRGGPREARAAVRHRGVPDAVARRAAEHRYPGGDGVRRGRGGLGLRQQRRPLAGGGVARRRRRPAGRAAPPGRGDRRAARGPGGARRGARERPGLRPHARRGAQRGAARGAVRGPGGGRAQAGGGGGRARPGAGAVRPAPGRAGPRARRPAGRGRQDVIVAVTGAAGGLGRALVRVLVGSGHQVRAAVRAPAQAELVSALGAEPVEVDVTRPETLPRLVEGAEVVHHLAAWMGRPPGLAEAVNVGGTRAVARACAAAGVRRLVHASSVAVYGPVTDGVVTEETPLRAVGDPYGDSKLASEAAAREALAGAATELVVLRPTMVYGPASGSWTLAPVRAIRSGLPVVLGDGSGLVDAVAAAFATAGEAPGVGGRAYNVCGEPVTVRELLGAYARMLGAPLRSVPVPLARAGAALAGRVTALLPGVDRFAPETLLTLLSRARFDGAAAARDLGYRPRVPRSEEHTSELQS